MNGKLPLTFLLVLLNWIVLPELIAQTTYTLSDEFDDPTALEDWKPFYKTEGWPNMIQQAYIEDGLLILEPYTSGWYADYHAPFLFKEVSGDFTVVTRLKVSGKQTKYPQAKWSLAGLMVRAPRDISPKTWEPNKENWLFFTTGIAEKLGKPVFETKTTINSKSTLKLHSNKLDWVQLKVERLGPVFNLYYKYEKEEWQKIESFYRPGLPSTLQVGINAYTDFYAAKKELRANYYAYNTTVVKYGNPDLRVYIDYVRFTNKQ